MIPPVCILLLVAFAASLMTACTMPAVSPTGDPPPDLRLRLELSDDVVDSPHDAFVTVIAQNVGSDTLVVATGYLSFTVKGEGATASQLPVGARAPGPFKAIAPGETLERRFSRAGLNDGQVSWRLEPGVYHVRALFLEFSEGDQRWVGRIKEEQPTQVPDGRVWTQRVESPPVRLTVRER
ncbi:MAG: hypothetical protein JJU36_06965 [Phycisphaeraceae bacterium]|nr:hypothetical protein [Phycisphaeraceae bacterium]